MLYAIFGHDIDDSLPARAAVRLHHVEYVRDLLEQGRLILAGPHPAADSPDPGPAGFTGTLVIAEFDSLEAAEEWAANDPYKISGVFTKVEVKPLLQVLP